MYAYERSLVKKMRDRRFALIGINSDDDLAYATTRSRQEDITWRSFWNGPDGRAGPISTKWNVKNWPTNYLIDHTGVIRHKNLHGDALDRAIEALTAAAEK